VCVIALYVDDLLLACKNDLLAETVKKQLRARYKMTDSGKVAWYLGMKIDYDLEIGRMSMSQTAYIEALVAKFLVPGTKPKSTPMKLPCPTAAQQPVENSDEQRQAAAKFDYRGAVGSLLYVSLCTRPDIAVAVSKLASFVSNPGLAHIHAVRRVIQYLSGTMKMGLHYTRCASTPRIVGYVDSSWGDEDSDQRKSTTGYLFYFGRCLISWATARQRTVARSSTEAEIIAASDAVLECLWLQKLCVDLELQLAKPIINGDNETAILNATTGTYKRTKYIDVRIQHTLENVNSEGNMDYLTVSSGDNTSDAMTKPLVGLLFIKHRMGMHVF
jgi:hypothetical protein